MKANDKDRNLTILGKETSFNGLMKFNDALHIEGAFTGAIDAKGFLYIGKTATCNVEYIRAASIVVEGTVHGPMTAVGDVELKPHSSVVGNIVAKRLKIADDVSFDGVIHMTGNEGLLSNDMFSLDVLQFTNDTNKDTPTVPTSSTV